MSHRQLSAQLEELSDEHSLHSLTPHPSSLLCEIEQSMEQEEQEQEREQVATGGLCGRKDDPCRKLCRAVF